MTESKVNPVGTGQEGAGTPSGASNEIEKNAAGKPLDKLDQIADRAAHKGVAREHREDPTVFTK